ncbi:MAG: pyridoxamine 5'-phosphate oxidase family protein [Candidatus Omnitrophota bacterium]
MRSLRSDEAAEEEGKKEEEIRIFVERRDMPVISEEIKTFLREYLVFVATVDAKGMPNVVPKGNIAVLDDDSLVFADLYSHQTKKNLLKNPKIAISVVNPASYKGYQLKGKAEIIKKGKAYEKLAQETHGSGQLLHPDAKYAVKVKVTKIIDIGYGETADKEL